MDTRATEAATLAELGELLRKADLPPVVVRLPTELARRAVEAWERDDVVPLVDPEPLADRRTRHLAGMLALIGLTIKERGRPEGDAVLVALPVEFAGIAMDAALDGADVID